MKISFYSILFFVFSIHLISAQGFDEKLYGIYYQLTYQPDSTNHNNRLQEDFYLNIQDEKSAFLSMGKLKADVYVAEKANTLTEASFSEAVAAIPKTRFKFLLVKEDGEFTFYDETLSHKFAYTEEIPTGWVISPEEKTIGDYLCKKATLQYGGRTWNAWYTEEIPIPEGPYKFKNLPGLVVKVEDSKGFFSFELIEIHKGKRKDFLQNYYPENKLKGYKTITKNEYKKALQNINDNYRQEMNNAGMYLVHEKDYKSLLEKRKRRNNHIEK